MKERKVTIALHLEDIINSIVKPSSRVGLIQNEMAMLVFRYLQDNEETSEMEKQLVPFNKQKLKIIKGPDSRTGRTLENA